MIPMVNASINLTKNCNLKCSYCFTEGKSKEVITLEMVKKSVDFLFNQMKNTKIDELPNRQKRIDISFWGGEPLLEWELLKETVLYAKNEKPDGVDLFFSGTTNGVLLTPDKFDFLDKHSVFFMVSLDGTEETHDTYRLTNNGKGTQKIIVENLKEALKKWPFYKVRMSIFPKRINHFYEDIKYLVDLGVYNLYFSPVYELEWTEQDWEIWKKESFKVVDLIKEYQDKGIEIKVEHFISYSNGSDGTIWPCGAGRNYIGIDTDGSIFPCHRFIKFNDKRHWSEKEWCIGHVEHGITKPDIRDKFINFVPNNCLEKECYKTTPCHGSCYATNFDITGDITIHPESVCSYVKAQKIVSNYYKENVKPFKGAVINNSNSCICYNLCYLEGTKDEVVQLNPNNDMKCHCYNTNYSGVPTNQITKVSPQDVMNELKVIDRKISFLSEQISKLLDILINKG